MTTEKTALWQQAFGDSPEFIQGFFRTGYCPERCRFLEKDGVLAAILYWFDCQWAGKKVAYIYGVATDKRFRGQGLCRRLMEDTHRYLQAQGYHGAALVPGDAGLFHMYKKLGYRGFSPMARQTLFSGGEPVAVKSVSPADYRDLATAWLPAGSVVPGEEMLRFFATYGQFYAFNGGCFCAARERDALFVQEFFGDPAMLPGIGAVLGVTKMQARLPGSGSPFAMYYSFTDGALPEYLAIALD